MSICLRFGLLSLAHFLSYYLQHFTYWVFQIKNRILQEKKRVEAAEQNRQKKHIKKFGKKVQQEKAKMKKQQKQKRELDTERFKRHEKKYGNNSSRGVGKFSKVFLPL